MLKQKLMPIAVAATLLAGSTLAQAEWSASGNVALTSDYKFRGISQSNEDATVQGGLDLEHSSGFYLGTWASGVDFGDSNDSGSFGTMEIDYYAGYGSDIGDSDFSYDVGVMYYAYPGDTVDPEGDYVEIYGSVGWNDLTVGVNYSDDYYAETDKFTYVYAGYSFALPYEIALDLHVGYNMLEEDGGFLTSDEDAYTDYSVGVTKSFLGVDFTVAYVGTDLDSEDVGDSDIADGVAVFTIGKSL
jgi:uncharacterized protein (TIGR02001 family)